LLAFLCASKKRKSAAGPKPGGSRQSIGDGAAMTDPLAQGGSVLISFFEGINPWKIRQFSG
jgi:hypothetical protein